MPEPINVRNAPNIYRNYFQQAVAKKGDDSSVSISEEAEANAAALAYCTDNSEADCAKLIHYFSAYGYELKLLDIFNKRRANIDKMPLTEPPASEKYLNKFQWVIGLVGFGFFINDHERSKNNQTGEIMRTDMTPPRVLLPEIGLIYRPSYRTALDAGLRPMFDMSFSSFSFELAAQFKFAVWRQTDKDSIRWHKMFPEQSDIFDSNRVNLGIGPALLFNLYRQGIGSDDYTAIDLPDSFKDRALPGGRFSLEVEKHQSMIGSVELSAFRNSSGQFIYELILYAKWFYPSNPKVPEPPSDGYTAPAFGLPMVSPFGYHR